MFFNYFSQSVTFLHFGSFCLVNSKIFCTFAIKNRYYIWLSKNQISALTNPNLTGACCAMMRLAPKDVQIITQ